MAEGKKLIGDAMRREVLFAPVAVLGPQGVPLWVEEDDGVAAPEPRSLEEAVDECLHELRVHLLRPSGPPGVDGAAEEARRALKGLHDAASELRGVAAQVEVEVAVDRR